MASHAQSHYSFLPIRTKPTEQAVNNEVTVSPRPTLLGIPRELRIMICLHLVKQGQRIDISAEQLSADQRKWQRELDRLKGRPTRRKKTGDTRLLRVYRELYLCGVSSLWGGNTFIFASAGVLDRFLDHAREEVKEGLRHIVLGGGYFMWHLDTWEDSEEVNEEKEMSMYWPPDLSALSQLPNLTRLELYTSSISPQTPDKYLKDRRSMAVATVTTARLTCNRAYYSEHFVLGEEHFDRSLLDINPDAVLRPHANPRLFDTFYPPFRNDDCFQLHLRDKVLISIPDNILAGLTSLKTLYRTSSSAIDWQDPTATDYTRWTSKDCLQYAQDLRGGEWRSYPYLPVNQDDAEEKRKFELWIEARAAVHWDARSSGKLQWSTWAREWKGNGKPRTKEDMIETGVWPWEAMDVS